ncbi:major capsid protein P2 [Vibrio sp. SCSIO 43137]|uniref:major capsid protein P2 n=1 Tax=Vibrio sp. SCSIO 43137 TaxID=3021011 RepID=UPI0023075294|nr:major capsid protein P2 [Vibrio sp. SCSIO 43137]WCE30108.1 major capsid protein P2 [Vibrio sp. SCSIO 43137]
MKLAQVAAAIGAVKGLYAPTPTQLDPFRNTNPYGKHAIIDLSDFVTYQSIEIKCDLPIERLGRVSIERDTQEIVGIEASFFHKRDSFKKLPFESKGVNGASQTRLILPFADETMRTQVGIRRGEYVHKQGEKLMIKIQVLPKESGDPDVPSFDATARTSDGQAERYFQQRWTETSITHSQKGEQKHDFPIMGQNVRLRSMLLECENDDIVKIQIKRNKEIIWEKTVEDLRFEQARYGDRKVPAKGVWIDFCLEGWAAEQAFTPIASESLKLVIDKRSTGEINICHDYIEIERLPSV